MFLVLLQIRMKANILNRLTFSFALVHNLEGQVSAPAVIAEHVIARQIGHFRSGIVHETNRALHVLLFVQFLCICVCALKIASVNN